MNITPCGTNHTQVSTGKFVIFVSYQTPVAYYDRTLDKTFKTSKKWSNTTTRHLNKWLAGFPSSASEVSQETIDALL
jgi:hypothetical protein